MKTVEIFLINFAVFSIALQRVQCADCTYRYTHQPPPQPPCNPYQNQELRLECSTFGPLLSTFSINWYRIQNLTDCQPELLHDDGSKILIFEQDSLQSINDKRRVRSQVRVRNLQPTDTGLYWCQITDVNLVDSVLLPSNPLYLAKPSQYSNLFNSCSTRSGITVEEEKCALAQSLEPSQTTAGICNATFTRISTASFSTESPPAEPSVSRQLSSSPSAQPSSTFQLRPTVIAVPSETPPARSSEGPFTPTQPADSPGQPGEGGSDEVPTTDQSHLVFQLYMAIGVLVVTAIVLAVLVCVAGYVCFRSRHHKTTRRIQRARVRQTNGGHGDNAYTRSTVLEHPVAAGECYPYEVPTPSVRVRPSEQQVEHSYDVPTCRRDGHEHEDAGNDELEGVAAKDVQVNMNHNRAYRACVVDGLSIPNSGYEDP